MDKSEFRKRSAQTREMLLLMPDVKSEYDEKIFINLQGSDLLKNISQILCYVSVRSEAGTEKIIRYCLDNHIKVAVPKCFKAGKMEFYQISSLSDLTCSHFGIPEPEEKSETIVSDFSETLCIVPGLSFDKSGNRIGYGGGYYDRFLSEHSEIITAGICFHSLLSESVPSEPHDISVDYIITEKGIIEVNG